MLLLVDIDGTLLRVDRRVTRQVWSNAWEEVVGGSVPWERLDTAAGKTDFQILSQLLGSSKVAWEIRQQFFDALAKHGEYLIEPSAITLYTEALEFLRFARDYGMHLAVLSGNERRCGWHKLRAVELEGYFTTGFFGCDAVERLLIPARALQWAQQYLGRSRDHITAVVVGDTPNDVIAARVHGLRSIAVATGPYSYEKLLEFRPTECVRHLGEGAVSLRRIVTTSVMERRLIIAIDGPAGSGKTTTARLLAERLGYTYIDTGAMYRALTLAALEQQIPLTNDALAALAERVRIELRNEGGSQRTYLDGRDVTERIRQPDVTALVSQVSSYPSVRDAMVRIQQQLGQHGGIVMDGRDIGTAVFPDADVKVFMTADLDVRARRRLAELHQSNPTLTFEQVKQQLQQRDMLDSTRQYNPLRKAEDALVVDTTALTIDEQVESILRFIRHRLMMSNSPTLSDARHN
ncbi:MAG: (d)CMP kinase [Bacteroidota bacterium]|nr:(d)CMP kinase [Bacteroidota bacterium]